MPVTFLNCHAFNEAVYGGSLQKRNLYVEGACTPHQVGVTVVVLETFEVEK